MAPFIGVASLLIVFRVGLRFAGVPFYVHVVLGKCDYFSALSVLRLAYASSTVLSPVVVSFLGSSVCVGMFVFGSGILLSISELCMDFFFSFSASVFHVDLKDVASGSSG